MLNAGIIGLGFWGRKLVASVQGKSDQIRFTAAMTRTPEKAQEFASEQGIRLSGKLRDLLDDPAVDVVIVASANAQHAPQALAALNAGKPTMVIKPFALSLRQAMMLSNESEKLGVPVMLGYNRGFFPSTIELKRRISAGDLGILLHAEGNFCVDRYLHLDPDDWKADPSQTLPGWLADHMLYDMINICGPVADVHALAAHRVITNGLMDTTAVLINFREGITGLLSAVGATADYHRLAVFGDGGWGEVRRADRLDFAATGQKPDFVDFDAIDTERAQLEAFAGAIRNTGMYPISPPEAVHGVAVLEAIARSAKEKRPISLD